MRFARGDMRDHIVSHKNDHGASYWRYGILRWRSWLEINICEIFGVVRFSTFATISAKLGSRRFNHVVRRGRLLRTCRETDHRSGVLQDAARFRKTISFARSTKPRKLAAMWRRPG
jgi:hypothetical protein